MRRILLVFLLALFALTANAGVVKGIVRDENNQPLPYVFVLLKNSTYGINTNLNGAYFLELKPGTHTLVFSQLGYETQEQVVTILAGKTTLLDVGMKPASKELGAVEITARGDRDKGKEIMKKVIDNRDNYWSRVQNYKCTTYQKSSLEKILVKPSKVDSLKKDTIAPEPPKKAETDTTKAKKGKKKNKKDTELEEEIKQKQLNLIESISETYFRAPGTFKENILAYHDFSEKRSYSGGGGGGSFEYGEHEIAPVQYSNDNPYLLISDAQSIDFNFYRNQIDAPALSSRPLLSPAAATAFLSYRFEFLGSFDENGKTIHKIGVLPLFKSDALFSGSIFIQDSTWAIVSVNLSINPDVLLFCKEFRVIQDYSEVAPNTFLPVRREFLYTIREGKYNILGNTRVDHSNYQLNIEIPKKLFTDEVKHFQPDAFDKDSAYWVDHRTIRLEEKEIAYIHVVDSLQARYKSPEFLAEKDSANNVINVWSFLLNGVYHINRAKGIDYYIDPLIAQVQPFGVGGYRHRLGAHFNKDFKNSKYLETDGQIDYGFLNKDVRGKVGVGLTYYPLRFVRTFVRFGDFYDMVNTFASLESVFSRSNYVRCREISVAQRMEIVNGLFGEITLEYSDQFPITGLRLEQWSTTLFGSLNTPADFQRYVKSEVRLELKYRFRQKYIIKKNKKIILGSKFPEVRFLYRKGIPGVFNSEVDFDYIEFSSIDELKLARFGTSSWSVLAGAFVNKKDLRLLEYKYFRGSDSFIFSDPLRSFQLLGRTLNTPDAFFRVNYIHHFEGLMGNKIPFFNKLKITGVVGGGVLLIPSADFNHQEIFVGLERIVRIRKQLFRFGVFAVTADNSLDKPQITYKFGIGFYNTYTRKWSY
jgi:hypothetical protein